MGEQDFFQQRLNTIIDVEIIILIVCQGENILEHCFDGANDFTQKVSANAVPAVPQRDHEFLERVEHDINAVLNLNADPEVVRQAGIDMLEEPAEAEQKFEGE